MILKDKWDMEEVVAYFKILGLKSSGSTEEHRRKSLMANITGCKMTLKINLRMTATSVMV
jgi:hypothetical protein